MTMEGVESKSCIVLWLCIVLMFTFTDCTLFSSEEELQRSMAEAQNLSAYINKVLKTYDKKLRPNAGGKPVVVKVEFKVISFGEIQEVNMQYSMDIFFRQWWYDPRFAHNFSKPFTMAADPTKLFWTPDTYFWNVKNSKYHHVTRENMRVMIHPDGRIYFSARITLVAQCDMDLRLYPMDTQECFLRIESYAHTVADVDYEWRGGSSQGIEIVSKQMAQFDLLKVSTSTKASTNSKGSFASLKATFKFRRRMEYFVSSVYVPSVVLVVLSWCCFFITPTAVPARIALSITTILTTILLSGSVNANMPKVSYMKAIDFFLLTSFGFIFGAMAEFILVLNTNKNFRDIASSFFPSLFKKEEQQSEEKAAMLDGKSEVVVKMMDHGKTNNSEVVRKKPQASQAKSTKPKCHWIDFSARFIFPTCYILFLIIYWVHFDSLRNKDPIEV